MATSRNERCTKMLADGMDSWVDLSVWIPNAMVYVVLGKTLGMINRGVSLLRIQRYVL